MKCLSFVSFLFFLLAVDPTRQQDNRTNAMLVRVCVSRVAHIVIGRGPVRCKSKKAEMERVLTMSEEKIQTLPGKVQKKVEQFKRLELWREQSRLANEQWNPKYKGYKGPQKKAHKEEGGHAIQEDAILTVEESLKRMKKGSALIDHNQEINASADGVGDSSGQKDTLEPISVRKQLKKTEIDQRVLRLIEEKQLGLRPPLRRSSHFQLDKKDRISVSSTSTFSSVSRYRARPLSLTDPHKRSDFSATDRV